MLNSEVESTAVLSFISIAMASVKGPSRLPHAKTALYLAVALRKFCLHLLFYILVCSEAFVQKFKPNLISYKQY